MLDSNDDLKKAEQELEKSLAELRRQTDRLEKASEQLKQAHAVLVSLNDRFPATQEFPGAQGFDERGGPR